VQLEGLGKLKKSNNLIGIRTSDLLACSIVPQPNTLSRAPLFLNGSWKSSAGERVNLTFQNCEQFFKLETFQFDMAHEDCCRWDVMQCCLVDFYQCSGGACRLGLHSCTLKKAVRYVTQTTVAITQNISCM
jgi:hypothetical protein